MPGSTKLTDTVSLSPGYTAIDVQKDILAFSTSLLGVPTLSLFTQTFHVVPEPNSVTLLGIALAALVVRAVNRTRRG